MVILLLIALAAACTGSRLTATATPESAAPLDTLKPEATAAPTSPPTATPTVLPSPTPTPQPSATPLQPITVFIPSGVPVPVASALQAVLATASGDFTVASTAEAADVVLAVTLGDEGPVIAKYVYAVVAPFPTIADDVAWTDLVGAWRGAPTETLAGWTMLVSADTANVLTAVLGEPPSPSIAIVLDGQILQRAWDTRPSWAIIPFEQLEPRWKTLRVDGHSVLDRRMESSTYPLAIRVSAAGDAEAVARLQGVLSPTLTNRDPMRMTVVVMTGVTALTRGTAIAMERYGTLFPAQDIGPWLLDADITHLSSEVSFARDCPPPSNYTTLVFCSDPRYIELLEGVDVDALELTGNHLLDWGVEAMELSLEMYDERGIRYYGGGWDLLGAQVPLTITARTQTFGFLGCNPAGPASDWAAEDTPGSAPCDYELLFSQIRAMREAGIIPIVTLQYHESDQYEPLAQQREDFRALAEAGAAIVSGSQAHQPQGFDFHAGALIHYGLGNLFFDQMWWPETRQEFVDRHVFYDGRHISTELLTMMLEDYARPRPMTPAERESLLSIAFAASGW